MEQITAVDFYVFRDANVSVYFAIAYTVLYQSLKSSQYLKSNQSIFNISFGRFARNYVGTLAFHKISTLWRIGGITVFYAM